MIRILLVLSLLSLTACGVDGEPEPVVAASGE